MSRIGTILLFMLLGALVGAAVASIVVPPMLSWYNEPGAIAPGKQVETICNIPELIRYTASRLLRGQLIGAAVGALVFVFPGIVVSRRHARGVEASTTAVEPSRRDG